MHREERKEQNGDSLLARNCEKPFYQTSHRTSTAQHQQQHYRAENSLSSADRYSERGSVCQGNSEPLNRQGPMRLIDGLQCQWRTVFNLRGFAWRRADERWDDCSPSPRHAAICPLSFSAHLLFQFARWRPFAWETMHRVPSSNSTSPQDSWLEHSFLFSTRVLQKKE